MRKGIEDRKKAFYNVNQLDCNFDLGLNNFRNNLAKLFYVTLHFMLVQKVNSVIQNFDFIL